MASKNCKTVYILAVGCLHLSTAILRVTHRISSELRNQAPAGLVSTTMVADHVRIPSAVPSLFDLHSGP
eukprot:COSAG05_NODE_12798_length_454_cov_0.769014_1_plen_68_part_10